MKIALIAPHFPTMSYPCGAADFVHQYCLNLKKQGHEVTVLTNNLDHIKIDGIKIIAQTGPWGILRILGLRKLAKDNGWDIIDLQYEAFMFGGRGTILFLPLLLWGIHCKFILTLHSQFLPKYFSKIYRLAQMVLFDEVVFYSSVFMDRMKKTFTQKQKNFHLLGFPSNLINHDLSDYNELIKKFLNNRSANQLSCLYFGHISPQRGIEHLIQTISKLKSQASINLTLMSQFTPNENQYHRDLISLIKQSGLEKNITFTGRVDDKTISLMFKTHDLCLFPFPEGASLKNGSLAAAIEHGMAIITTKTSLTDSVFLTEDDDQWFYEPHDIQQLEKLLIQYSISPELCKKNRNFWARIRDYFSWKNYINKREQIFKGTTHA